MGYSVLARVRTRLGRDDGFSLVEAVVALSILAMVSTSFAYGMNLALRVTRDDRLRQQATHLAERELEVVRNKFQHSDETGQLGALQAGRVTNDAPLPGGTVGQPLVIDGRKFTVERTSSILTNGEGESACDGASNTYTVDFLTIAVNVKVSWSDSGQTHAVENNTLLTPIKGVEGDVGFIAAKLTGAAGTATGNVPVVVTGPSGSQTEYTANDGCAVFMLSTAGTYTVRLNAPGYVNVEGFQLVEKTAALEIGKLKVIPFSYEPAGTLHVTYGTAAGHALPATLPAVTLFNTGIAPQGELLRPATGTTTAVTGLWPFADGYTAWAGSCDQSDPALNGLGHPRPTAVPVAGGATATAQVYLAPVSLQVVDHDLLPALLGVDGVTLEATPADPTNCGASEQPLTLGTTSGGGYLATSLPAGVWTVEPAAPWRCEPILWLTGCPVPTETLVVVGADGGIPSPETIVTLPTMAVDD